VGRKNLNSPVQEQIMQNAKDTFYITLRNRLAVLNPARIMTLRGLSRPGILVEEAEQPMPELPTDVFVLRWTALEVDNELPAPLASMQCQILYATAGTQGNNGLDRGRALEEMDYELTQLLAPPSTQKMNYTVTPAATMNTQVFWTPPIFTPATTVRERLNRVATVTVFAFQEQGEQ
jgi:hypothetical protein